MANSLENIFIDALIDLLKGMDITLYNGESDQLISIYYATLPDEVHNNTNVVIIPKGPKFDLTVLGRGASIKATDKVVYIQLLIFHDGPDEELVLRNLSNITFTVVEKLMDNRRLAGASFVQVFDTEYDWAKAEDQDKPGSVLAVTSAVKIPIIAVWSHS